MSRFYKSKACTTKNVHDLSSCCYAHHKYELIHPKCISYDFCQNQSCKFMHSYETIEEFRKRTNFTFPQFPSLLPSEEEEDQDQDDNDERDDERVEVILNESETSPEQPNDICCNRSFRPLVVDMANPMSFYWATMAIWSERDLRWV